MGSRREPLAGQLAEQTGTNERYVREWLGNQAAGGYVDHDADTDQYYLNAEQAPCLADPDGPVDLPGAYHIVRDLFHVRERARELPHRRGHGVGRAPSCLFHGTERFFRAGYNTNLIGAWLPALDGVMAKLGGARAADVGCGHGASTVLLAKLFRTRNSSATTITLPRSRPHASARPRRACATRSSRSPTRRQYETGDLDFIAFFDCLHDMADPVGAARHAREALEPDGDCMLVEPMAGDSLEDNRNPVGRIYYGASSLICVPVSLARSGPALGAQAGEQRLREVMVERAVLRASGVRRRRRST